MANKTLYPCTCNSFETDPYCLFCFSKETRIRISPVNQELKDQYQFNHQEAYEKGVELLVDEMKEKENKVKLLIQREYYDSHQAA